MWCDDLNKSINSLQLLKENDIDFIKKIHIINSNYEKQHENKEIIETKNKDNKMITCLVSIYFLHIYSIYGGNCCQLFDEIL